MTIEQLPRIDEDEEQKRLVRNNSLALFALRQMRICHERNRKSRANIGKQVDPKDAVEEVLDPDNGNSYRIPYESRVILRSLAEKQVAFDEADEELKNHRNGSKAYRKCAATKTQAFKEWEKCINNVVTATNEPDPNETAYGTAQRNLRLFGEHILTVMTEQEVAKVENPRDKYDWQELAAGENK